MGNRPPNILLEIDNLITRDTRLHVIESRATNVIHSAINLVNYIRQHYDSNTATELERRLINSIRGQDASKFTRAVRKLRD